MTTLNNVKNGLIGHITASKNEKLMKVAINSIFNLTHEAKNVPLSAEQMKMLLMSEKDII